MTEQEAKTKWCPFVRFVDEDAAGSFNRGTLDPMNLIEHGDDYVPRCIGSACMAFRWSPDASAVLSGYTVIVDAADADLLDGCWWDGRYAKSDQGYLHRLIAERLFGAIPPDMFVDHIDGNTTNYRRGNLRVVTKAQNAANASSRGGASRYRGVFRARNGKWAAQIARQGARMHLGTFETEEAAAAAYDEAAARIHGEFARPNLTERAHSGRLGFCGLAGKP